MISFSFFLQNSTNNSGFSNFLPIILIIMVIYFFMIRPQINKQKQEESFQSKLKKGDKIITIGGIHGKINGLKEGKVILEINDSTKITIDRQAISREKSTQIAEKK